MPNAALIRETGAVHRGVELLHKSPDFFLNTTKYFLVHHIKVFKKPFVLLYERFFAFQARPYRMTKKKFVLIREIRV